MDKKILAVFVIFIIILTTGCTYQKETFKDTKDNSPNTEKQIDGEIKDNENKETSKEDEILDPTKSIDLSLKPNEAGEIMVLMYHNIGKEESTWVRTVENFKKDLQVLYDKGYRPISLKDFVSNDIDIEAGFTPVVITFDDGQQNNFNIIEKDGEKIVDPDCAVGIMEEFHKKHPDFPLKATFFVFGKNPFRQKELVGYKLNYLVEKGFDIGNHTIGHENFTNLGPEEIQKAVGENAIFLESIIKDYTINTLALPFGSRPKNKEYEKYLQRGKYEEKIYDNIAILNVGWKPSVSPIDKKFNPYSIQRVRASETNVDGVGMYDWLDYFDKHPEKRYISDGNPKVVTVPKKFEEKVDKDKVKDKMIYIYEE